MAPGSGGKYHILSFDSKQKPHLVELYPSPPVCCHLINTATVTSKGLSIFLSGQFWMVGYMVILMRYRIVVLLSGDSRFTMEACPVFVKVSKLSLNGWMKY